MANLLSKTLLALSLAAVLSTPLVAAVKPSTPGGADLIRLTWTDDPATTMTIGWRQASGDTPYLLFREKGSTGEWTREEVTVTRTLHNPRDAAGVDLVSNFTKLTGLQPNSDYEFAIGDSLGATDTMWFRTAPDAPAAFTFIAGGDSRTNPEPRKWGDRLVSKIRPLFVIQSGDFMDNGRHNEWVTWLTEWQMTRSSDGRMYPMIPVHGNHENDVTDMVQKVFNIESEDAYYAMNVGGTMMRLWVLNSELEPTVGYDAFLNQTADKWNAQKSWLATNMEANPGFTWKLAAYHRPMRPHTTGKVEGLGRIAAWAQTFYDNNLDVAIECDTHMVKHTYPVRPSEEAGSFQSFVRDDANGFIFTGEGSWGAPVRPADDDKPWTLDSESLWQYKVIAASPDKIEIRTVQFGREEDLKKGIVYDPETVTELTQAERDTDPHALPTGLMLWKSLAGEALTLPFTGAAVNHIDLVTAGNSWRYNDTGADLGTAWKAADYDDSAWSTGQGAFGYGDGDERTVMSYGADGSNKIRTYYFRNQFDFTQVDDLIQVRLWLQRDDGAVVYLNGKEVARSNMPEGPVTSTTFASSAIGGDGESTYYEFPLMPESLQAGTNTIAVELHQSDASSSDTSFDLALVAVVSNSTGTAPVAPASFAGIGTSPNTIELTWTGDPDVRGYQIESKNEAGEWFILYPRVRMDADSFEEGALSTLTQYEYRIRSYNEFGLSPASTEIVVSTLGDPVPVLLNETFEEGIGGFQEYSVSGTYKWINRTVSGEKAAYQNGFGDASGANVDWLISPAVNTAPYGNPTLTFETYVIYDGGDFQVFVSTDYVEGTDPATATWTELAFNKPADNSRAWTVSEIDLTPYSGETVSVGFLYTSTGSTSGQGAGWHVDDVRITGERTLVFEEAFGSQDLGKFSAYSVTSTNRNWAYGAMGGVNAVYVNGYGGDAASDDYLITPALDMLRYGYAELTFDTYVQYAGGGFEVLISTDYTGTGDPTVATWTPLAFNKPADNSRMWTESGTIDLTPYTGSAAYIAFHYTSTGTGAGDAAAWYLADVKITGKDRAVTLNYTDFNNQTFGQWTAVDVASVNGWINKLEADRNVAHMDNFGATDSTPAEDWLISPALPTESFAALQFNFLAYTKYSGSVMKLMVSTDYTGTGNPNSATWTEVDFNVPPENSATYVPSSVDLTQYISASTYIAFKYTSIGWSSGSSARWAVDDLEVLAIPQVGAQPLFADFSASSTRIRSTETVTFEASASGGSGEGYTYTWQFSDGTTAEGATVTKSFTGGMITATLTVTDSEGGSTTRNKADLVEVIPSTIYTLPAPTGQVRVATFNSYLNRATEGKMLTDLQTGTDPQMKAVAEIIQRVRPDVLLINEFDYIADGAGVEAFIQNYLMVSQNGQEPIDYGYYFLAPSNTGIQSGFDFDNDGNIGTGSNAGNDAYGFGEFPGQYAMVVLSRYYIYQDDVRTFQMFKWKDMPGALRPINPAGGFYHSEAEWDIFRLSSKSHWDVPVDVYGEKVHILASHPTPPVFDDGEISSDPTADKTDNTTWDLADWNGLRNHDEIRFWADYVNPEVNAYFYDDNGGTGGLPANSRFVMLGDQNCDPNYGDATFNPISLVLSSPLFITDFVPQSEGGLENNSTPAGHDDNRYDTADWGLRADYVLPSTYGFSINQGAVFWPVWATDSFYLVGPGVKSSDHRLVWLDLSLTDEAGEEVERYLGEWTYELQQGWYWTPWIGYSWPDSNSQWIWSHTLNAWLWAAMNMEGWDYQEDGYWFFMNGTGWIWTTSGPDDVYGELYMFPNYYQFN